MLHNAEYGSETKHFGEWETVISQDVWRYVRPIITPMRSLSLSFFDRPGAGVEAAGTFAVDPHIREARFWVIGTLHRTVQTYCSHSGA